jgi:AcrR family transcriptional regulator
MERRLTARGKERRRQLMDFAAARFAEGGYHPTSVAEIVHGVGVGKGVFYWYFDSKEQLFLEILREAQTGMRRAQRSAYGEEPDAVRRIELGIRASLRWLDEHRAMLPLFQFAATEEQFAPAMRRGAEIAVADTVRHLKEGIVEGRIRDVDPEVLANCVVGVTNQLSRMYLRADRRDNLDEVADAAVAFCLDGLRVS